MLLGNQGGQGGRVHRAECQSPELHRKSEPWKCEEGPESWAVLSVCVCVTKSRSGEGILINKHKREENPALTPGQEQCLSPPVRTKNHITHRPEVEYSKWLCLSCAE